MSATSCMLPVSVKEKLIDSKAEHNDIQIMYSMS